MSEHHAFLYRERSPEAQQEFIATLKARGAVTVFRRGAWGIDDSRDLKDEALRTDPGGQERIFIIEASSLTVEAQNALLKLFEEPPRNVSFHCFFAAGLALLPTLRSRVSLVTTVVGTNDAPAVFIAWQRLPLAEQLSEIEDRTKKKDQVWIEAIKQGALAHVGPQIALLPPAAAARLYFTLTTIGQRGASNKMLLEEVALTLASVSLRAKTR